MILLPTSDSKIWNMDSRLIAMTAEIVQTQKLELYLNMEGPCAESLGLYRVLDEICASLQINKNKITIYTCNLKEYHPEYQIIIIPGLHLHQDTKRFDQKNLLQKHKPITRKSKHFGMFNGRSNWVRLWIAGNLWQNHSQKVLLTYHWRSQDEFHDAHLGLDDMLAWNAPIAHVQDAIGMLSHCPITLDTIDRYPILRPENLEICKIYPDFFVEIICETYFTGRSFFPTEKTWRPLMMKTPFILHGPVHYLKHLRQLGFKTFDRWWNEEYDDYGHDLRTVRILQLLQELARLDHQQMADLYHAMQPTLEHNYQIFCNLDHQQLLQIFADA